MNNKIQISQQTKQKISILITDCHSLTQKYVKLARSLAQIDTKKKKKIIIVKISRSMPPSTQKSCIKYWYYWSCITYWCVYWYYEKVLIFRTPFLCISEMLISNLQKCSYLTSALRHAVYHILVCVVGYPQSFSFHSFKLSQV
jgi:hypothetical protein